MIVACRHYLLCLFVSFIVVSSKNTLTKAASPPIYINAGGPTYRDPNGNLWIADTQYGYHNTGLTYSTTDPIQGTTLSPIYQSERYDDASGPELQYAVSVPNGEYSVLLHFAEIYAHTPRTRLFDVLIQGRVAIEDLDIFKEVGHDRALIKQVSATVTDKKLNIEFVRVRDNPKIAAIEIHPKAAKSALYINAGGQTYVDSSGKVWEADSTYSFYNTGLTYTTADPISGTNDDPLYQSERYDAGQLPELVYDIPVANGNYDVVLHFAEIYATTRGARLFDVKIEGRLVIEDLDIFREVGHDAALTKRIPTTVADGKLKIEFIRERDNPKISAIEILPKSSSSPTSMFINAGGPSYTDGSGNQWVADADYGYHNTGLTYSTTDSIAGTIDYPLYQSERYGQPNLTYKIPLQNGDYDVIFHFAEVYALSPGFRVFNVLIGGGLVFQNLDIFKEVGHDKVLIKRASTTVTTGELKIEFIRVRDNPKISAIEIRPRKATTATTMFINAGGQSYMDANGDTWAADAGFTYHNSGLTYSTFDSISGTNNVPLYQSERWGNLPELAYDIPIPNGKYFVTLHFAEIFGQSQGFRVFDVWIQGNLAFENLDIFKEVGHDKALLKQTSTTVTNGKLSIVLSRVKDNPKISAIEVRPWTPDGMNTPAPTPFPTPSPTPTPGRVPPTSVYINAGGDAYTDRNGITWEADKYFNNPIGERSTVSYPIANAIDSTIYQSERWDDVAGPELKYVIPVKENGNYEVTLHFSEVYGAAQYVGARVFDVWIQGNLEFESLDIYLEVGGYTALTKSAIIDVKNKLVTIEFTHVTQNPTISGIEIVPSTAILETMPQDFDDATPTAAPSEGIPFSPYHINVGGDSFVDNAGNVWDTDSFSNNLGTVGKTDPTKKIYNTDDENLYRTERWGADMVYDIPVPNGDYEITLHFAEIYHLTQESDIRIFNVLIEDEVVFPKVDIFAEAGGYAALKKVVSVRVLDEAVTIAFEAIKENPKLSGIEVTLIGHYAHAVPGGPYLATDTNDAKTVQVTLDGSFSHTHGPGARLYYYKYFLNGVQIGGGQIGSGLVPKTTASFPIGEHVVWMEVGDTDGSVHRDFTTVTVRPYGFPDISSLSPDNGDIQGGERVVISGSGFSGSAGNTIVHFGEFALTGSQEIRVINQNTIVVLSVPANPAGEVSVSVETPVGESNLATYRYINFSLPPVKFRPVQAVMPFIYGPSSLAFGPDGKLYVATVAGTLYKLTLDDNHEVIDTVFSDVVALSEQDVTRTILGIAFDPMDTSANPSVYVSHSFLFHKEIVSNNAKVSRVSGANLDKIEDVITGLPVSDHDHAVNGMEFGDDGELYIQVGGNTNAGVPGEISQSALQEEGYLSCATLVAYLSRSNFDGDISYDEEGNQISGFDVEVYAPGLRNSYDIVLHSNGNLYAADNGANNGYGAMSETCSKEGKDPHEADKLIKVVKGAYYGHPNRKRGETDSRQCTWWSMYDESNSDYTAPIAELVASSNGIVEFQTEHFGGQLRGHLIIGRYQGALFDITLSATGDDTVNNPAILVDEGGLDVTQGPDGSLFVAQNFWNKVLVHEPEEIEWSAMQVKSVFPRRGPLQGGSLLSIYGDNFGSVGSLSISVGGRSCPLVGGIATAKKIQCRLPGAANTGWADVVVSGNGVSSTISRGYKYIRGR